MVRALVVILVGLAAAACNDATGPSQARVGTAFSLALGESAVVEDAGLQLRFVAVFEDSRCPAGVQCIWAGQAIFQLELRRDSGTPDARTIGVGSSTIDDAIEYRGYRVALLEVRPSPPPGGGPVRDYRLTLKVTPGAP